MLSNNNIEELRNFITLHSFCYIRGLRKVKISFHRKKWHFVCMTINHLENLARRAPHSQTHQRGEAAKNCQIKLLPTRSQCGQNFYEIAFDSSASKGQLISRCLFGVFNFFQKTNENTWHSNEFICSVFGRIHSLTICFRD